MKNLPSVSYSLLLFLFLNTLFLSCSRDNDEIITNEEPVFQPIQGQVVDYITKEGIPDLDLELIWRDLFEGGVTDRGRTDNNGEFT
ncbi:MAG: hypothetical protein HKO89_05985, partial [Saprospiraceae bacterium]|nr:hypothetical protein [Saprospiraceae bacterium]